MGKRGSGLFLGLLAGTALGVLFAPKKGKELRESIKKERNAGGTGAESIKKGFKSMGKEIASSAKTAYESDEVQEQIGKAKTVARKTAKKAQARLEEETEEVVKKAKKKATKAKKRVAKAAKKVTRKATGKATKFKKRKLAK